MARGNFVVSLPGSLPSSFISMELLCRCRQQCAPTFTWKMGQTAAALAQNGWLQNSLAPLAECGRSFGRDRPGCGVIQAFVLGRHHVREAVSERLRHTATEMRDRRNNLQMCHIGTWRPVSVPQWMVAERPWPALRGKAGTDGVTPNQEYGGYSVCRFKVRLAFYSR